MSDHPDHPLDALYPDRDTHAAFHRGAAWILLAIAATLTLVGGLMRACGASLWCLALGVPVLLPAAAFAAWARVLRTTR
jgi:hypothetical protein